MATTQYVQSIRAELESLIDKKYRDFSARLIPGCDNLIGVRIPELRKIAKCIAKDNPIAYLNSQDEKYFEETMLKGLIIGYMKEDTEVILEQAAIHIPKITNWSLCDSFCSGLGKIVQKNKARVWDFLEKYWQSEEPYDVRVAVVLYMNNYIDEPHLNDLFYRFNQIKLDHYYVKMAVAWAISVCFVKFPEQTMVFLKDNQLDDETYNKALQKIRESLRVDKSAKEVIKPMKR